MSLAVVAGLSCTTPNPEVPMSYQAYLDALETKTGRTPQQLLDEAAARGYGPKTKAGEVVAWLAEEYGVGRGHAMALYGVLKKGSEAVPDQHVGSTGPHRDESKTLRLDGSHAR
jgi:Domain of unknown function (DUF4287)